MTDTQEAMREEFEAAYRELDLERNGDGYWSTQTQFTWKGWQAATAQSAEKIARLEAVLSAMYKCFKDVPTMEETGFDTPPEPASQWDYDAFLILAEAERILPPAPELELCPKTATPEHIEEWSRHQLPGADPFCHRCGLPNPCGLHDSPLPSAPEKE